VVCTSCDVDGSKRYSSNLNAIVTQLVECHPSKLKVVGSNPIYRSMRICDIKEEDVKVGLRVKSLDPNHPNLEGTITERIDIDRGDENPWVIKWDDPSIFESHFIFNDCECEIVHP
jgi:hypothetical protein